MARLLPPWLWAMMSTRTTTASTVMARTVSRQRPGRRRARVNELRPPNLARQKLGRCFGVPLARRTGVGKSVGNGLFDTVARGGIKGWHLAVLDSLLERLGEHIFGRTVAGVGLVVVGLVVVGLVVIDVVGVQLIVVFQVRPEGG